MTTVTDFEYRGYTLTRCWDGRSGQVNNVHASVDGKYFGWNYRHEHGWSGAADKLIALMEAAKSGECTAPE